LLHINLYNIF